MAFELPPLPYAYDALEPTIDKETMTLHHDKHHKAYTDKLNEFVEGDTSLQGKSIEEIMGALQGKPAGLRNNGGGYWNHDFFWKSMKRGGAEPTGALKDAIEAKWGSVDAMKEKFNAAGVGQFGSGWVWLIVGQDGELAITSTPNQDNPLMDVAEVNGTPILGNDVWEHAYYISYRNVRPDYLKAWWNVVDWDVANERYEAAKK
ncbi:superoxide dismutase [uncultured Sphingomonas sp.]|uniref:superoxide dismutase n=1 Tax=uncultured Sphingomonas sp. TaxID=158754 RepID=UPI0025D3F2EC|nr:superoxide dismutase [uncultured Sphingomonas sp.]